MGKPGKKAGAGMLPPTNVKRRTDPNKSHLRDQRTIKRLKMYTSKVVRDEKGHIVKGSVLKASDRVEQQMARIAPDRRWFGNTRVIGQEALQKFRAEMGAKYRDPYSIIIKQGKLPLSLLEEPKQPLTADGSIRQDMQWGATFGDKATRKRVRLRGNAATLEEVAVAATQRDDEYTTGGKEARDRALVRPMPEARVDATQNRVLFKKGQSNRIWNELYKVVDSADVILYVLDARDPLGTRSPFLEDYLRREKKHKHFVLVLNKCDLIPLWATARWLQILSKDFPTIAFHASVNHPFGKGNLISLLRQFAKLHNVTHRGSKRTKTPISVGVVGYPNVGKSSLINTLRKKSVCKVAPIPGETKVWQYVALTRSIFMIDCPGVVYDREGNNDVQAVLKGVVRIERLGGADKTDVVQTVLEIVKHKDIVATYGVLEWRDVNDFLEQLAKARGKLVAGGEPDVDAAARMVLYDWQRGRVPWFNAPPFDSHQQYRDAVDMPEARQMKLIEHYSAFNVVDDRIELGANDGDAASSHSGDEDADGAAAAADDDAAAAAAVGGSDAPETAAPAVAGLSKKQQKKKARAERAAKHNPDATVATVVLAREENERREARLARRRAKVVDLAERKRRAAAAVAAPAAANDDELWTQFVAAAKK